MTHPTPGNQDALTQLADRCGIATGYHDIWGDFHSTSDRTRRALLTAMRFPAEADPATLLLQLEDDEWRRMLPPVLVSQVDSSPAVPLSVPEADENFRMYWTLTTEAGNSSGGEFVPSQLNRLGEGIQAMFLSCGSNWFCRHWQNPDTTAWRSENQIRNPGRPVPWR